MRPVPPGGIMAAFLEQQMVDDAGRSVPIEKVRQELEERIGDLTRRIDAVERELAERTGGRRERERPQRPPSDEAFTSEPE
jgi:hypothetical protein